jgi:hypothetical protein
MLLSEADFILNLSGLKLVEETVASVARHIDPSLSMRTIDGDSERLMRLSPRFLDGLEALCADVMKLQGGS